MFQRLEDPVEHRAWGLWANGTVFFPFLCREGAWQPSNVSPCFTQEPPKEDLTVSEKFQLVLDVAQKAQVRDSFQMAIPTLGNITGSYPTYTLLPEPFWQDGRRVGEDKEVRTEEGVILLDESFFHTCLSLSACLCGCNRRARGNFTSACGWLSSAPVSCPTNSWASW